MGIIQSCHPKPGNQTDNVCETKLKVSDKHITEYVERLFNETESSVQTNAIFNEHLNTNIVDKFFTALKEFKLSSPKDTGDHEDESADWISVANANVILASINNLSNRNHKAGANYTLINEMINKFNDKCTSSDKQKCIDAYFTQTLPISQHYKILYIQLIMLVLSTDMVLNVKNAILYEFIKSIAVFHDMFSIDETGSNAKSSSTLGIGNDCVKHGAVKFIDDLVENIIKIKKRFIFVVCKVLVKINQKIIWENNVKQDHKNFLLYTDLFDCVKPVGGKSKTTKKNTSRTYENMTKSELLERAKKRKIKLIKQSMRKAEIISLLRSK